MDWVVQVFLVVFILFLSTFVRSALGFGDALLAMPLLTMVVGLQEATPLVAFVASTIALAILLKDWRNVDLGASWRLILSSSMGIPVGLFLLKAAPEALVKGVLGALLIAFGLYQLLRPQLPSIRHGGVVFVFGFIAGILGGAYNTNGPPIIVYGTVRGWSPERFRATLQGYFFPTGLIIIVSHALTGLWTAPVLRQYAIALPMVLLGIFLGSKVNRKISGDQFQRIVYACLIAIGLFLILAPT